MRGIKERLTYANVMSTVAVVLAIGGGTAFAAYGLGKNSVKSRNIAPGAVRAPDLAKNAVRRGKIAPGAINAGRLANGSVTGPKIAGGAVDAEKLAGGSVGEGKLDQALRGKVDALERGAVVRVAAHPTPLDPPEIALMSRGPFRIYGKCFDGGLFTYAYVYAATTAAGTIAVGTLNNLTGQSGYLDPDTPESPRRIGVASANAASSAGLAGSATLVNGSNAIQFGVTGAVRGTDVPAGAANYGPNGSCLFAPYLIALSG